MAKPKEAMGEGVGARPSRTAAAKGAAYNKLTSIAANPPGGRQSDVGKSQMERMYGKNRYGQGLSKYKQRTDG